MNPGWPAPIREVSDPAHVEQSGDGQSGDGVFRVHRRDGAVVYVKVARAPHRLAELRVEADALRRLDGRLGAPAVLAYHEDHAGWLVTTEVSGLPCHVLAETLPPRDLLASLARALRQLHDLPATGFADRRPSEVVRVALARAEAGLVDLDELDPERAGMDIDQLVDELTGSVPDVGPAVLTHGDPCLPNLLATPEGVVTGLVDWGRAGLADPYLDLALLHRSFLRNAGELDEGVLCEAYGVESLDHERLAFYRLLDEFF